jgi:hypothetical protein
MARRRRNRSSFIGEPNGLNPGDDVGNRINQRAKATVPDDIGNRIEDDKSLIVAADDIGNRIDQMPTHDLSGVLSFFDDGRKNRRRKPKGSVAIRVGRYLAGGVNPLVATDQPRAQKAQEAARHSNAHPQRDSDTEDGRGKQRKRKRRDAAESGHGADSNDLNERRAQRFFDFEEDDQFEYLLKTAPEEKRIAALTTVEDVVRLSNRKAKCTSTLLDDGNRPKILVTIEETGVGDDVPADQLANNADKPLFALGNAALMSLNYIVNKIVNRYPDDRIRLAILPKSDEASYLSALAAHQQARQLPESSDPASARKEKSGRSGASGSKRSRGRRGEKEKDRAGQSESGSTTASSNKESASALPQANASSKTNAEQETQSTDSASVQNAPEDMVEQAPAKKVPAKKTATKKAATKKTATKKTATKKTATKKTATKKTATKKTATKKTATKKTATKKTATKKTATKKTATKKTATKKTATKKTATKKAAAKK